jgi:hypothetical protein
MALTSAPALLVVLVLALASAALPVASRSLRGKTFVPSRTTPSRPLVSSAPARTRSGSSRSRTTRTPSGSRCSTSTSVCGSSSIGRYRTAQDPDNYYALAVSVYDQQVALYVLVDGEHFDLVEWTEAPAVRKTGVNRTVVRFVGSEIRVNVNGVEVLRADDDTFSEGMVGYGAATWGAPATVNFDNIIVTTPTSR